MRSWRVLLFSVVAAAGLLLIPAGGAGADHFGFYIASDSYYTLDVPNGSMNVRVEAEIQNASGSVELKEIVLWVMPAAQDILVKQGDTELTRTVEVVDAEPGTPLLVTVTLAKPLKGVITADLVMTYTVPAQSSELVKIEPGAIEAMFVSQGHGSFVFIDVPASGDNYVEPGCLQVASQPATVEAAGMLRFVCGEALSIAIETENADLQARCARLDDSCRQRLSDSPFVGFAQSITDPAKQLRLEETIELQAGPRTLTLLYFRTDRTWAEAQFAVAKAALPMLEEAFGRPYPHDRILLRESNLLLEVALGIAFTATGEMLITNTGAQGAAIGLDDREVTVHELAHQWAGLNLDHPWLWEGQAEWGMRAVQPALGFTLYDRGWASKGYTDPLATWYITSPIFDPDYWYGKAGAFWQAYEAAIGGRQNMSTVLGMVDDAEPLWPLEGRWFQDRGEEVSGANLDELFLTWVYVRDTAAPLLAERRAARDSVNPLRDRAATMLLTGIPRDIQANLDDWAFERIAGLVVEANKLLDDYISLLGRAAENGGVGAGLGTRWNDMTMAEVRAVLDQMSQALDAIAASTAALDDGVDDPAGREALERARERFLAGEYAEAKVLAANATSISFNKDAASKLLIIAQGRDAAFEPNFLQKIGLFFGDPSAHVTAAEVAFEAGDYETSLVEATTAIEEWKGAQETGLFRLSIAIFGMFGIVVGGWLLLRRVDLKRHPQAAPVRREGHALAEPVERSSSWQEWLNQKDSNNP